MTARALASRIFFSIACALLIPGHLSAAEPVTINMVATPTDAGGEAYYAQAQGFFKAHGLDVQITNLSSGPAVAAAMASGRYDVALGNLPTLAAAREAGLPFVLIAPGPLYSDEAPTSAMVVGKDSPLKTPADLNGKTVAGVSVDAIGTVALDRWLASVHLTRDQIHILEIPDTTMGEALNRGTVAAAIMHEPFISAEVAQGGRIFARVYSAIAPHFMIAGYYTRSDWAQAHPEAVKRFAAAIVETARWANRNPAASAAILERLTSLRISPGQTRARFTDSLQPKLIQPVIDAAVETKMLKTPLSVATLLAP